MSVDGVLLSAKETKKNSLEKERRVEKTQCELKRERERERERTAVVGVKDDLFETVRVVGKK